MSCDDILPYVAEVQHKDLPQLLQQLAQHLPDCLPVYGLLETELNYDMREYIERRVYTPIINSVAPSFIAVYPAGERVGYKHLAVFWDVDSEDDMIVASLLGSIPDLDWTDPIFIQFSSTRVIDKLESLLFLPGLGGGKQSVQHWYDGYLYLYTEKSPSISVPEGFHLGPLKPEHAEYVMKNLPYEYETYRYSVGQITQLPTSALFRITEDGDESCSNPVSWTTTRGMGLSGKTFTIEEYRRRGFSTVVNKDHIRKLLADGQKVWAFLGDTFDASIKMHQTLGYKKSIRMCMTHIQPEKNK